MRFIFSAVFALQLFACGSLRPMKDCAAVAKNDAVGDNKFLCRDLKSGD
jgi:hypothetical protein